MCSCIMAKGIDSGSTTTQTRIKYSECVLFYTGFFFCFYISGSELNNCYSDLLIVLYLSGQ